MPTLVNLFSDPAVVKCEYLSWIWILWTDSFRAKYVDRNKWILLFDGTLHMLRQIFSDIPEGIKKWNEINGSSYKKHKVILLLLCGTWISRMHCVFRKARKIVDLCVHVWAVANLFSLWQVRNAMTYAYIYVNRDRFMNAHLQSALSYRWIYSRLFVRSKKVQRRL